jgi:hypothetical protein
MAGARSRLPDAPVAALAYDVDRRRYGVEIAIIDAISGAKVAVYVSDECPFTREQFARARILALGSASCPLPFASPEGVILAKLRWYRDGGETSEQQWRDVAGILTIMAPELDRVWLEQWAVRLGVHDLLDRMHSELAGQD